MNPYKTIKNLLVTFSTNFLLLNTKKFSKETFAVLESIYEIIWWWISDSTSLELILSENIQNIPTKSWLHHYLKKYLRIFQENRKTEQFFFDI